MSSHVSGFEGDVAASFFEYEKTIRGQVRYEVVRRQLAKFLTAEVLEIADIGGGSGSDTLWLAEKGHHVTLVEPGTDQLALASERFAAAPQNVQERIKMVHGGVEAILEAGELFDVVLSHGVAMYQPDPKNFIQNLASITKPGGHISLLEKGYAAMYVRLTQAGRNDLADILEETGRCKNNLNEDVWAFRPEYLDMALEAAHVWTEQWTGVRVLHDTDKRTTQDLSAENLKIVIDREYKAGQDESLRGMGQMLHFIGQK